MVIFRLRGAVGCKKVKKKKNKKKKKENFSWDIFIEVFLFLLTKRAEKVIGFVFFRKGRGKM